MKKINFKYLQKLKKFNLNKVPKFVALMVLLFSLGIGEMWGFSSYYAQLTASVADGTGTGTVYVASPTQEAEEAANDPSAHAASSEKKSSDSQNTDFYFTVYATAARGSVFSSWSAPSGNGNPAICNGYSSTSNPILVKVTSKDSDGTNEASITANFVATSETPFDVYFLEPDGVGTYAVSSYINYPTPVQGGDPVPSYSSDEIKLTATNGEGYGFRRFYYVDADGKKKTLGELAQKEQFVTLSSEMKKIGCEFVASWEMNYVTATNGSFTAKNGSTALTVDTDPATTTTTYADDNITLAATPSAGYAFFRYKGTDAIGNTYTIGTIGLGSQTVNIPQNTVSVTAEFTDKPFVVGANVYSNLDGAIQATRKDDGTYTGVILLVNNYTVPAGYYTIPAGVTLLIPKDATQLTMEEHPIRYYGTYSYPSSYRKLTLENGVNLDVFGKIQAGGTQGSEGQISSGANPDVKVGNNGSPVKTYGWLYMKGNSKITLENGAHLYAWGYVTGERDAEGKYQCGIDARRGSVVHEFFQIKDWRGGTCTGKMNDNMYRVFPLNQYYIQNIECPITFRPGSKELCDGTVNASSSPQSFNDVDLIGIDGSGSLFEMDEKDDSEDTWVKKWYDVANDKQVYDINSAASLGSITLTLSTGWLSYTFTSGEKYYLPVTNNMKFHLLTGKLNVTENAELLPGAEIEIEKEATAYINSGRSLYLFSIQEWDKFNNAEHTRVLPYSPSWEGSGKTCPRSKIITEDAALTIHGTVEVNGSIHTTEHGANISSTDADAGTIIYNTAAPATSPTIYVCNNTTPTYNPKNAYPALLRNGNGSDWPTAGTPAGQSYCYQNGKWVMMTVDTENSCFVYDNYGTYYAKPGAYVALANGKTENGDHTYSDADGRGRLYILMDECQWWEVQNDNNLYKGITRDEDDNASWNGKYYEYNTSTGKWEEKRYSITWKDWDGSVITTYQLTYGTTPQYLSTNPTRDADVDYTYNFSGWSPAFTPVTGDQTYTATYSKTRIKYTVIFKFVDDINDGAEIDRQQLARDEMPSIPSVTPREGWYIKWTPAIGVVTGPAVYEAEWIEDLPDYYTVTWKNYDGSTLSTTTPARDAVAETVLAGAPANPTKPATSEYRYEFAGWQPTVAAATADAVYTAQYNEVAQTYAIRFFQENGTTQIGATQNLIMGADPVVPAYSKANTAEYTYQLQWKIKGTSTIVGVSVPSVSAAVDYQADFIATKNRYTISANSELEDGTSTVGCTFTGAGTYDYGTNITLTAVPNTGYEFVKWKDDNSTNPARQFEVSGVATYTAIVKPAALEIDDDETKVITRPTQVSALVVSATPTSSSNLVGADNVSLTNSTDPVYFDLTRGAGNVFKHHTWYAFSVPFEVDPATIMFDGKAMQYNTVSKKDDYEILYYNGAERAANGKTANCWVKAETANENLVPGQFYMIANTRRDITTIRFPKVADADLLTTSVDVSNYASGNAADANWNGIANPALYHANMDAIGTAQHIAHVFNPDFEDPTNAYQKIYLNSENIKLGTPFFVQAPTAKSVVVEPLPTGPMSAPRRARAGVDADEQGRYQVLIARENGKVTDDVIVLVDEEKEEDTYVLGRDLVRMGMSTINPQMWVDRYDEKLCVNVQAPVNNEANYPLGIFAPANGNYDLWINNQPNDNTALYLTMDGEAIWNLSDGKYTLYLSKGNTHSYGLRIVGKKTPETATGVDEAIVDAKGETQKVLINNQVFIIRENHVYSVDGQLVK